jgi:hypothetical protein
MREFYFIRLSIGYDFFSGFSMRFSNLIASAPRWRAR